MKRQREQKVEMKANQFTIRFRGDESDGEHLLLPDFAHEIVAVCEALEGVDHLVGAADKCSVVVRVVDLKHSSPARVTVEASARDDCLADISVDVIRSFMEVQANLNAGKVLDYPRAVLVAFRDIAQGLTRRVREIAFEYGGRDVVVGPKVVETVEAVLAVDEEEQGSMTGMLELLNVHEDANTFRIYPSIGPSYVTCTFKSDLRDTVLRAAGRYIQVTGTLKRHAREEYPHEIAVAAIEIMPDESDLPKLADLKGMAPGCTGDMASEDFVDKGRHDEW